LKRQTRQRREFLYKKALEARERQIWEKKQAVKDALAKGKPVPTELKKELDELREAMSKDAGNSGQRIFLLLAFPPFFSLIDRFLNAFPLQNP
jgi:hypothetical protein